jgi:hypothetical protein
MIHAALMPTVLRIYPLASAEPVNREPIGRGSAIRPAPRRSTMIEPALPFEEIGWVAGRPRCRWAIGPERARPGTATSSPITNHLRHGRRARASLSSCRLTSLSPEGKVHGVSSVPEAAGHSRRGRNRGRAPTATIMSATRVRAIPTTIESSAPRGHQRIVDGAVFSAQPM